MLANPTKKKWIFDEYACELTEDMLDYASNQAMLNARLIGFLANLKVGIGSRTAYQQQQLYHYGTEKYALLICMKHECKIWFGVGLCAETLWAGELLMSFDFQVFHEKSVQTAFSRFVYLIHTFGDANPYPSDELINIDYRHT